MSNRGSINVLCYPRVRYYLLLIITEYYSESSELERFYSSLDSQVYYLYFNVVKFCESRKTSDCQNSA